MKYDYLILLDFELTGDGSEAPAQTEIVEFSWVVWDCVANQRADANQIFVKLLLIVGQGILMTVEPVRTGVGRKSMEQRNL
jgi:hypothetical protein